MTNVATPSEALGAHRLRADCKEEVIAYLAAAAIPPVARRKLYRAWCAATFSKCRREDLARVAPGKPREIQLSLLSEG